MPAKKKPMSKEHKAALAEGREQGRKVRAYLEAMEASKPTRGRKPTPESIQQRLAAIEDKLPDATPVDRVSLIQDRIDLTSKLEALESKVDMEALKKDFVTAVKPYSERKGISYAAWREAGVPAAVLREAGLSR